MEFYCFEREIQLFGYFLVWQVAVTAEHEDFATLWWHLVQGFVYDMLYLRTENLVGLTIFQRGNTQV